MSRSAPIQRLRQRFSRLRTLGVALSLFALAPAALPCSVPVFRYALDHWTADAYRLEAPPADAKTPEVAKFLRNFGANSPLNLVPVRLPAASTGPARLLFPPSAKNGGQPAWTGVLDGETLSRLVDSPARREIVRRILAGQSMVWVLVESGKADEDDAVAVRLEKRLGILSQATALPPPDADDPSSEVGPGPPVFIKFSLLRIRSDDPAESPFLAMLAGPNEMPKGEPWLAPVFGRGRVLGSWPAKAMDEQQIEDACLFLVAGCSCQVKDQNPGWDLLLTTDWDKELISLGVPAVTAPPTDPSKGASVPPSTGAETAPVKANPPSATPEVVTIHGQDHASVAPDPATPSPRALPLKSLAAGTASLLLAAGGLTWRKHRSPK